MPAKTPRIDVADGAMAATVVIWAANNVIVKAALSLIAPFPYVFGRCLIVSTILFAGLAIKKSSICIRRRDLVGLFVCGCTGFAYNNLVFTVGLEHSSAFSASVLTATGPIFAMIFAAIAKIERVRPIQWAGAFVAFCGVAVFVGAGLHGIPIGFGEGLLIASSASFAFYTLATRPFVARYGSPVVTAWSSLFGFIAAFPLTIKPVVDQDWSALGTRGWSALFYSSVMSMLVGYIIWAWAVQRRGVGRTVVYLFFVPVVTGALSAIFLGEQITTHKLAGAALVLGGVGLARIKLRRTRRARSSESEFARKKSSALDSA